MAKNDIFPKRLKELRAEKGITQKALAKELGISLSSVINYENGQRFPVSGVLVLFQKFFNVNREYLIGESNERLSLNNSWNDSEIITAINDNLSLLLDNLGDALRSCDAKEQKLTYDILVELLHILKIEDGYKREGSISLLQNVFTTSTRFVDVCTSVKQLHTDEIARIDKAKENTLQQYERSLSEAQLFLSE